MTEPGRPPHDVAGIAVAEAGLVLLDGPDGVAIAMTPDAAEATGKSLIQAAALARTQSNQNPQEPA